MPIRRPSSSAVSTPYMFRSTPGLNGPGGRHEVVFRIFGVQARFDSMSSALRLNGQGAALGDLDLHADQVQTGDHFRDRMLHLNARVGLDEVEFAGGRQQKLDGSGIHIAGVAGEFQRGVADGFTRRFADGGTGAFFDDLLVAPLNGAVALEQVNYVAVGITEYLHFDMPGILDEFFDQ